MPRPGAGGREVSESSRATVAAIVIARITQRNAGIQSALRPRSHQLHTPVDPIINAESESAEPVVALRHISWPPIGESPATAGATDRQ